MATETYPTLSDRYDEETVQRYYDAGLWLPESLPELLDKWADLWPEKVFLIEGDVQFTYEQTRAQAWRLALRFKEMGLRPGDRAVLQVPNWREFIIAYLAFVRLGVIVVSALPHYRRVELSDITRITEASIIVVGGRYRGHDLLETARSVRNEFDFVKSLVLVRGQPADGEIAYAELADDHADLALPYPELLGPYPSPDVPQQIVFTSGTEGLAKGCVHTFNTVGVTIRGTGRICLGLTSEDRALMAMPIGHAAALGLSVLTPLFLGGSLVLMDAWDPLEALRQINEHECTNITAGPPFLRSTLEAARETGGTAPSLKVWLCGSAPIPAALADAARETFPRCRLLTNFGQSETYSVANLALTDPPEKASQSDGRAQVGTEMRIQRVDGSVAEVGEEGEICYRGAGTMLGYWADPERTAAVIDKDGWVHSGDLGRIDVDGYLRVTGRLKDLINRGGENISASEVESALLQMPAISQVAVVGAPDEKLGERVVAVAVLREGTSLTVAEVRGFLKEFGMAVFKWPTELLVVPEVPTTPVGKIKKEQLRQQLREGAEETA